MSNFKADEIFEFTYSLDFECFIDYLSNKSFIDFFYKERYQIENEQLQVLQNI